MAKRQRHVYTAPSNRVMGIAPRNYEQAQALSFLTDDTIDLVVMLGQAGTGKTLLALAAGLHQIMITKKYKQIVMTRATAHLGDEIGHLPGYEDEKMGPWMGAMEDNMEVMADGNPKLFADAHNLVKVKCLSFMQGRSFTNKFVIIDEAQNLSRDQMKALITRAGKKTKLVVMGDLNQIVQNGLTIENSGLKHLVDRFDGWEHAGIVKLTQCERSRLAEKAVGVL